MHPVDSPNRTFTTHALDRLTAYRAAVQAGFYSDWDGTAEAPDTELLAWLGLTGWPTEVEAYPFTFVERQRLERGRTAVVNGRYTDDWPPIGRAATPGDPSR